MNTPLIAVLDDDVEFLSMVDQVLEEGGYRRALYGQAGKGIEFLRSKNPDVAIVDLWFVGKASGLNLLEEIRKDPVLADTKLVICSGDSRMLNGAQPLLECLDVRVLEKPFTEDDLLSLVAQLMDHEKVRS